MESELRRQPLEIILNSKRGIQIGDVDGYKYFLLDEEIVASKDEVLLVHLKKSFIPFSFYTISSSQLNNLLDVKETQINGTNNTYTITIENGNYNINELIEEIKNKLEASSTYNFKYTITYNVITNKMSFLISSGTNALKTQLLFSSGGNSSINISRVLGFSKTDVEMTLTTKITSDFCCDLADGLDSLHIKSNISGSNIRSVSGGISSNELLIVPVNLSPNSILYFDEGNNPFKHKLETNNIKRIDIKFTDNNDNIVDFNNIPYTLILIFEFLLNPLQTITRDNKYLSTTKITNTEQNNKNLVKLIMNKKKSINNIVDEDNRKRE